MKIKNAVAHPAATVNKLDKFTSVKDLLHLWYYFHVFGLKSVPVLVEDSLAPHSLALCTTQSFFLMF